MKEVRYEKEIPQGLVLGRNKVKEAGSMIRVRVEKFQFGAQDPQKVAELSAAESLLKKPEGLSEAEINDAKSKKSLLDRFMSIFKSKDSITAGFIGYKITTWRRS